MGFDCPFERYVISEFEIDNFHLNLIVSTRRPVTSLMFMMQSERPSCY